MKVQKQIEAELVDYNHIFKETGAVYNELARHSNLPTSEYWVLYYLFASKDQCTQKDICDQYCMSKQTVNTAQKHLETKGYLRRRTDANDKRSRQMMLTEKGHAFANEKIAPVLEAENRVFFRMGEEGRRQLIEGSRLYLKFLEQETRDLIKSEEPLAANNND
ncbi:MarR family winged helix-turn-helix transcriptional regulator [Acetobacterium bakii]|uniref:MarR family winged helix-turn-helix transcriptional regulator n=1 Tax=Acetobacterium bakii TaxID=52689 RepID=UPI0006836C96|nr:MarR family transcriptional regulator [Acetobacterium bakii]